LKLGIKLLLSLALCASLHAQGVPGGGLCAAFSSDGSFAKAKLSKTSLSVDIAPPGGSSVALEIPLLLSGDACHSFFSKDGELLAVSIEDQLHAYAHVQVAVADVRTGKWLQSAPYTAHLADDARGPLLGFLGDSHTLLLLSRGTNFPDERRSLLYPVFLTLPDGKVRTGLVPTSGPPFTYTSGAVDVTGGHVWFLATNDTCGFQSLLVDPKADLKPSPPVKGEQLRAAGCAQPELVFAPSPNLLISGFSKANQFIVDAVDLNTGKLDSTALQAKGREGFLHPGDTAVTSDAIFGAIAFKRFDDTRSGLVHSSTEVAIFKTSPFALAATVEIPEGSELLAIGDAGGSLSVAIANKGKISVLTPREKP